jgi:hypothetical protein
VSSNSQVGQGTEPPPTSTAYVAVVVEQYAFYLAQVTIAVDATYIGAARYKREACVFILRYKTGNQKYKSICNIREATKKIRVFVV